MPQDQAVAVEQWLVNLDPPTRADVEEVGQVVTGADLVRSAIRHETDMLD